MDVYLKHTPVNPEIVCPMCGEKGGVRAHRRKAKKGFSTGKIMGGLFTGGISLLATGIAKKDWIYKCYCEKCGMEYDMG